ncbi:CG0192-related protein [Micromonospora auratinigra]|uniref:Maltokinase N-terminal cap domain-containing protein n=1 Tax=Micromonospora auratinigra TaxID=261654 RepID=A0A1A8Z2J5_9ACTN|nr:hypothetical protein [Micromonospora auratinigra]SBT38095.1 hypothetical protein GA0070611_0433 [Micromonospora auratinigra]
MALLHRAELRPSKLDLLTRWLPTRGWFAGDAGTAVTRVAAYRFDDPAGEVGVETMLVRAGEGPVLQVPLTYRGAPLAGADDRLLGTMEHSVLGRRWVYDAVGDPVYQRALAAAVLAGADQAQEYFEVDGERQVRPPSMTLTPGRYAGTADGVPAPVVDGDPTLIRTGPVALALVRRPVAGVGAGPGRLTGAWDGQSAPVLLAQVVTD